MEQWAELARSYPLMRGGGLFLAAVGLGLLIGALGGRRWLVPALIAGAGLGTVAMAAGGITKWIFAGLDRPLWWHWAILGAAFLVEGYLVSQVVERVPDRSSREFWLWMLFVVGAHFLILFFSHGPICGLLGLLCMATAYLGLKVRSVPYRLVWGFDGILKIAAGGAMVAASLA